MNGQSGLPVPELVGQSQCPATGAVVVPNPNTEGQLVLGNRKYTMGWEHKFRGSLVQSSPSVPVSLVKYQIKILT